MGDSWSEIGERGAYWGIFALASVYRVLGRSVCRGCLAPVAAYYYIAGSAQRRASRAYLERVWRAGGLRRPPGLRDGLRHFLSFSWAALDKLAAWTGGISREDLVGADHSLFATARSTARGALVLTAHVGNPEVVRALAALAGKFPVTVLVHTKNAERFNRVIQRFAPDSPVRLLQVTDLDMGAAMRLSEAVGRGEWIVMTADRVAVRDGDASAVAVEFLGAPAPFPTGPFILAAALGCPAYSLFCVKDKDRYAVHFEPFADPVRLPRAARAAALKGYAEEFARRLERIVVRAPFQWFNFYDYWPTRSFGAPATPAAGGASSLATEGGTSA